jgi:hypothetical protein
LNEDAISQGELVGHIGDEFILRSYRVSGIESASGPDSRFTSRYIPGYELFCGYIVLIAHAVNFRCFSHLI